MGNVISTSNSQLYEFPDLKLRLRQTIKAKVLRIIRIQKKLIPELNETGNLNMLLIRYL